MKKTILCFLAVAIAVVCFAQSKIKLSFHRNGGKDTVYANDAKDKPILLGIHIDSIKQFKNLKLAVEYDKGNIDKSKVYLPQGLPFTIISLDTGYTVQLPIIIERTDAHERFMQFKLTLKDEKNNVIKLDEKESVCEIYIEVLDADSVSTGRFEPWLFTGTNIDLLDGPKVNELYLKANFLLKVNPNNYLQFGTYKSRNFLIKNDSAQSAYYDEFYTVSNIHDSTVSIVNGVCSKKRTSVNEPVGIFFEYHRKIWENNKNFSWFGTFGVDVGQIKNTTEYTRSNLITDTAVQHRWPASPYSYVQTKIVNNTSNYYVYAGFFLIYNDEDYNFKAQLFAGLNRYKYFLYTNKEFINVYRISNIHFAALKFTGVIKNPGIGLGFEAILRKNLDPLLNFTLSKVIDFKNIKSIFSPVSAIKQ
jgi:hypothetical protein